jgi:Mg-chelatase subunit ChlD
MDVAEKVSRPARALLLVVALGGLAGCSGGDTRAAGPLAPISDFQDAGTSAPEGDDQGGAGSGWSGACTVDADISAAPTLEGEANVEVGDCPVRTIDVYGAVPDMLIVLDRSLSMSLNRRWEPSKQAVKTITRDYGGLLRFGMSVFPGAAGDCAQGQLDVPLSIANGSAIADLIDHTQTSGLTPTGPALSQALRILGDRSPVADAAVRPAYVLLVTDGEPNCQALPLFPDSAQQDAARAAVRALKDKNIPTYVIGYQIDASYQGMMNELAQLGGTARYRAVENADQIVTTFREITKDVVKCSFDLSEASDPHFVRVQIDQTSIALDASDGWTIQGKTVTLQGAACTKLRDGRGHVLNAQVECTEVVLD